MLRMLNKGAYQRRDCIQARRRTTAGLGSEREGVGEWGTTPAAIERNRVRPYKGRISTNSGFYRTFEVSITRKYSHWVLPRFRKEWSVSAWKYNESPWFSVTR